MLSIQQFRLQKIDELDAFLWSEMETRSRLKKTSTVEMSMLLTAHALRLL